MIRRLLAVATSSAALYAVVLGAGASAQDATPTASPTVAADATGTPTPFPSPVETVLSVTPTATPESTATPAVTTTPGSVSTPAATPTTTPEGTPTASPESTPTATPEAQQGERSAAPTRTDEELVDPLADAACEPADRDRTDRRANSDEGSTSTGRSVWRSNEPGAERTADACEARDRDSAKKPPKKAGKKKQAKAAPAPDPTVEERKPVRRPDGIPTIDHPSFAQADPGAAPIGVPNFFIDKFRIPPFLLPIYQAAGIQYGVRWEILAAINEIETDYGRNLNVSSAGALGWMQFMPATWAAYGVDANRDGVKDPYNPVDAIFAAARYLRAAGADQDLRRAIFAYNHADWYVDSVLLRAQVVGGLPSNFVGSLTGLTQARFPVWAKAKYAGEVETRTRQLAAAGSNAANVVESTVTRRSIRIFARDGAPVIAVNDGRVVAVGENERLGRYVQIQDVYGNTFTYSRLADVVETFPYPKQRKASRDDVTRELDLPKADPAPSSAASETSEPAARRSASPRKAADKAYPKVTLPAPAPVKERLWANPERPRAYDAGGRRQVDRRTTFLPIAGGPLKITSKDYEAHVMRKGARVLAGTILGHVGKTTAQAPHVRFEIRPAGRGAPRIDPKPILDGWKLLESTALYRAKGQNPLFGKDADTPTIGQILLMSKDTLARRVLANPRIDIYGCGRNDVDTGQIDRRVLATLEFLAANGLRPTVTSLKCGHGYYTASGNVSHHSSGNAVDIAAVNGIPIIGHQGRGSITDLTIQRLLRLQGTMKPSQIISLMTFEGADNTLAMGDHHDHIHVGWQPLYGHNRRASRQIDAVLQPEQWIKLIDRLGDIANPTVREQPSRFSVKVVKRASRAHRAE